METSNPNQTTAAIASANNTKLLQAILRNLTMLHGEITSLKKDVAEIKDGLTNIQKEVETIKTTFPYGIDNHRNAHLKKSFFRWG